MPWRGTRIHLTSVAVLGWKIHPGQSPEFSRSSIHAAHDVNSRSGLHGDARRPVVGAGRGGAAAQADQADGQAGRGFISAQKDFSPLADKLREGGEKPDPSLAGQLDDIAKKHGFKDFSEFEDVGANVTVVLDGLDPKSGEYADPVEKMKKNATRSKPTRRSRRTTRSWRSTIWSRRSPRRSRCSSRRTSRSSRRTAPTSTSWCRRRRMSRPRALLPVHLAERQAKRNDRHVWHHAGWTRDRDRRGDKDLVTIERPEDGVAVLTMARPHARNSLSLAMLEALQAGLASLGKDAGVSAIVLSAQGPAFCAGHDLKELTAHRADADGGRAFYTLTMRNCADLMQAIIASPKPVIAAVQATATAAGCQLVASCDLAVAADSASFCTPGSISVCSARHRWWRFPAMFRASGRWRCCCWARCCQLKRLRRGV